MFFIVFIHCLHRCLEKWKTFFSVFTSFNWLYIHEVRSIHLSLLIRRRDTVQKPHRTIITATSGYWKQLQYGFRALITSIHPPPSCYLRLSGTQTSPHYFYSTGIIMAYRVADGSGFPSQYGVECYSPISQDQMWNAL